LVSTVIVRPSAAAMLIFLVVVSKVAVTPVWLETALIAATTLFPCVSEVADWCRRQSRRA
jgi:hypothetical protein